MNVYDGERMAELMAADGMTAGRRRRRRPRRAQHLPHPREGDREGLFGHRPDAQGRGQQGRAPMIAVAGCVAQAEGEEIVARAKVDVVVGPQAYHNLPALVAQAARGRARRSTPTCRSLSKFGALPARRRVGPSAFLTVQEGCDKFCTYCVVPYTRGAEVSRAVRRDRRRGARAGRCRRARDHAARPERQRLDATASAASTT